MFNVGVHMLSLAGEHLLVQTCFMFLFFFVLLLFVLGVVSTIQRGQKLCAMDSPQPWYVPAYHTGKTPLNCSIVGQIYFRQIQLVFLLSASLKCTGKQLIKAVNQNESVSLLYTMKMNIWPQVCQQGHDAILMNERT